ncbi:GATA zinc finger-domain-containing protein [Thamnidium elegans]|nr:GATA zinc finger-domain-containing protein [Thamnidium elegans]
MDVSKLCESSLSEHKPKLLKKDQKITASSLDFILSPVTEPEMVFDQCSKLCQSIWQLKVQHRSISVEERDAMINNLSKAAENLYRDMQSTHLNFEKQNNMIHKVDEEEEEEDDEEEEEEEGTPSKITDHVEYELIRQARNLQDTQPRPKYRRRNRRSMIGQKCHSCSTTETPEWRRGPDGARTLCNACGLHYSKLLRKGSIGVQTQNYLITGGVAPNVPSIVSASAISDNNKRLQVAREPNALINFPFVLMDPKYGMDSNMKKTGLPIIPPTYTQPSYPVNSVNISPQQSSSNQNNITPLRIHQWKQHN